MKTKQKRGASNESYEQRMFNTSLFRSVINYHFTPLAHAIFRFSFLFCNFFGHSIAHHRANDAKIQKFRQQTTIWSIFIGHCPGPGQFASILFSFYLFYFFGSNADELNETTTINSIYKNQYTMHCEPTTQISRTISTQRDSYYLIFWICTFFFPVRAVRSSLLRFNSWQTYEKPHWLTRTSTVRCGAKRSARAQICISCIIIFFLASHSFEVSVRLIHPSHHHRHHFSFHCILFCFLLLLSDFISAFFFSFPLYRGTDWMAQMPLIRNEMKKKKKRKKWQRGPNAMTEKGQRREAKYEKERKKNNSRTREEHENERRNDLT